MWGGAFALSRSAFFFNKEKEVKYTIIDSKKRTPFIQQTYDSIETANKRLQELNDKFRHRLALDEINPSCLRLAIVQVDEDGDFHELAPKASTAKTPPQPQPKS